MANILPIIVSLISYLYFIIPLVIVFWLVTKALNLRDVTFSKSFLLIAVQGAIIWTIIYFSDYLCGILNLFYCPMKIMDFQLDELFIVVVIGFICFYFVFDKIFKAAFLNILIIYVILVIVYLISHMIFITQNISGLILSYL